MDVRSAYLARFELCPFRTWGFNVANRSAQLQLAVVSLTEYPDLVTSDDNVDALVAYSERRVLLLSLRFPASTYIVFVFFVRVAFVF